MAEKYMTDDQQYQIVFNEDVKHSGNVISIVVICPYTFDDSDRQYAGAAIDSLEYVGNDNFKIEYDKRHGNNMFVFDVLLHGDHEMETTEIQGKIDPYVREIVLHTVNRLIPKHFFKEGAIESIKTLKSTEYMDYAYLFSYWVNIPISAQTNIFQILGFAMHSISTE